MRIFFDTEFLEDGKTIELISIGMVREDGATYYAVNDDFPMHRVANDKWMCENVIPHLPVRMHPHESLSGHPYHLIFKEPDPAWRLRTEIRDEILDFVGPNPEFWAWFADYDWVVLCQLFGRMIDLPFGWPMYCRDLKQVADWLGVRFAAQEGSPHHALADAQWVKKSYETAMSILKPIRA